MNSFEAQNGSTHSVLSLQQSIKERIKNLLFIGIGGVIGYNIIAPPILGAVIGGISGHIVRVLTK